MTTQQTERKLFRAMMVEVYRVPDDDECFDGDSEMDDHFAFWQAARAPLLSTIEQSDLHALKLSGVIQSIVTIVRPDMKSYLWDDVAVIVKAMADENARLQATIAQQGEALEAARKDAERLDWLADEYVTARPYTIPTPGGDDADVGWEFLQDHMGQPKPVVLHRIGTDNLRRGLDEAMSPICPSCDGSGDGEDESVWCKDCKGSGRAALISQKVEG